MNSERIDEFESLRGVMALWVVIGHVLLSFQAPASLDGVVWRLLEANGKAVDVFIILSGFIIFYLLGHNPEHYSRYIARRFLRLFPAYAICLLISIAMLPLTDAALHAMHPATQRTLARIAIVQAGSDQFWPHLLAHLTMLHGLIPQIMLPMTDYVFLGQAWSISVEWQFYLLAPFVLWMCTLAKRWIGLMLLGIFCAAVFHARLRFGEGFIGAHIAYFALGCGSYFFWQADKVKLTKVAQHTGWLIAAACLAGALLFPNQGQAVIWIIVLLSCNSMRFSTIRQPAQLISSLLLSPILRWLGRISYSAYLVHMIILNLMLWLLANAGLEPVPMLAATLTGTLVGTLITADVLHRAVELPCIKFGRTLPERLFVVGTKSIKPAKSNSPQARHHRD